MTCPKSRRSQSHTGAKANPDLPPEPLLHPEPYQGPVCSLLPLPAPPNVLPATGSSSPFRSPLLRRTSQSGGRSCPRSGKSASRALCHEADCRSPGNNSQQRGVTVRAQEFSHGERDSQTCKIQGARGSGEASLRTHLSCVQQVCQGDRMGAGL